MRNRGGGGCKVHLEKSFRKKDDINFISIRVHVSKID